MVGIVGYGAYVPRGRIRTRDQRRIHDPASQAQRRGIEQIAVAAADQDAVTMSIEASRAALGCAGDPDPVRIGCVYVGSCSHVNAAGPNSALLAEVLEANASCHVADIQLSTAGGAAALSAAYAQTKSKMVDLGLAIGVDCTADPDGLAAGHGAAAAALVLGRHTEEVLATIDAQRTERDPLRAVDQDAESAAIALQPVGARHEAALAAMVAATRGLFSRQSLTPGDFAHAVFHQPDALLPLEAGRAAGFARSQLEAGLIASHVGDTRNAGVLLGLAAALDATRPGQRILICSYAAGVGVDALIVTATERIEAARGRTETARSQIGMGPSARASDARPENPHGHDAGSL